MNTFPSGTKTAFARAVSAEIRAAMAARRITIRELAHGAGFASHNYVAIRLRDDKPFNLDDVQRICDHLGEDAVALVARAQDAHGERLWREAAAASRGHALEEKRRDTVTSAVDIVFDAERRTRPARSRAELQSMEDQAARHDPQRKRGGASA